MTQKIKSRAFFRRLFGYVFSGLAGAATNIVILYILTSQFGIWYILSGIISFTCSVFVSFIFHKKLTFNDKVRQKVNRKFIIFFLVAILNLIINTFFLYVFTDIFGIFYVFSQVIASIFVATWSYFIYLHMVFDVDGV